jgi:hypothetical protein
MGAAPDGKGLVSSEEVLKSSDGLGFERIVTIPGSTYKDNSTIIVVPMRGVEIHDDSPACKSGDHRACKKPFAHQKVISSWMNLIAPMNQKRMLIQVVGHEVGQAYNEAISQIIKNPDWSKWPYIMTLEDDNLPQPDAHLRLLESIEWGGFDAVSGLYFTKGDFGMPMAYGDPEEYRRTGQLDFRPRDIRTALQYGNIMEVNGIAMGCAIWKTSLFREIPPPWFVTVSEFIPDKGSVAQTQDLHFCEKARRAGKKFAVDLRVRVGHMDINTGIVY